MGQDLRIGMPEAWDMVNKICVDTTESGETHVDEKNLIPLVRYGYLEETYYSYKFVPVVGDAGYVLGHYTTVFDLTREVVSDRRTLMAQNTSLNISTCKSMQEFWPNLLAGLDPCEKDFPLVALYAASQYASDPLPPQSEQTIILEGCLGISKSRVPSQLLFSRDDLPVTTNIEKVLAILFQKSLTSGKPLLVTRDMLPDTFLEGITWRGFGTPSEEFLIIPLQTNKGIVIGFMFTGLNPMKRFHQFSDYEDHVNSITRQIIVPRASSILLAEDVKQGEENLVLRSKELERSETKYRNFAEHAPLGVALINSDRCMEFANEAW